MPRNLDEHLDPDELDDPDEDADSDEPTDLDEVVGFDELADLDEDDRDASYYECMWGGPDEDEFDAWNQYIWGGPDDDEFDYTDQGSSPLSSLSISQPGNEVEARKHFADLKRKYEVDSFQDASPISPLYKILLKLESCEKTTQKERAWLKRKNLLGLIRKVARQCEDRYQKSGDAWEIAVASSQWRSAGHPKKALKVTGEIKPTSIPKPELQAALLTTRGGAFRDIGQLANAETCGQQAIQLCDTSPKPYMLMGAIYYQKGNPRIGDEFFAKAIQRGANPVFQEVEIKNAVRNAEIAEQRFVASYLLQKDPIKYAWAGKYL